MWKRQAQHRGLALRPAGGHASAATAMPPASNRTIQEEFMGTFVELTAADGHRLAAYRCEPLGKPRGGLVIVQEIFGVNSHIRAVADGYAADGYLVAAPAIFDRAKRN